MTADDDPEILMARHGLQSLNFFVAAMQTGFGPFISVWLINQDWSLSEVGFALSVGTIASLCLQLPGGLLVDAIHRKRDVTAGALMVLALSALIVGFLPTRYPIWAAMGLHSLASVIIGPAIAALTLTLCGHDSFSERLGGNARYASIGGALAAGGFGFAASRLGEQSIFLITAGLAIPAALSLMAIRLSHREPVEADHMAMAHPSTRDTVPWSIFRDPIMHVFAVSVVMFHLSNAALLPLALGRLSQNGDASGWVVSACIIVPQLIVALFSPWAGAAAKQYGRKRLLLIGFLALPARALLFATNPGAEVLPLFQALDGVSATVLGLMLPLIAADLTAKTGHLNLAMGSFGLAAGLGATFSTTLAGWVADRFGPGLAFLGLALLGALAVGVLAIAMPETQPVREAGAPEPAIAE